MDDFVSGIRASFHRESSGGHSFSGQTAYKHLLCSHNMLVIVLELEVISEFIQALLEKEIHLYKAKSSKLLMWSSLDGFL